MGKVTRPNTQPAQVEAPPTPIYTVPRVVVWYDQGIVHCVLADQTVEVIVVDLDTDGGDPLTEIPHPDNYDSSLSVYVNRHRQVDVLPEWVDIVFNSEPIKEESDS